MEHRAIDPAQFNGIIADAFDYVAVKLAELGVQVHLAQMTKIRADIEDITMTAVESAILPHTPADWCWQKAARVISMEAAKVQVIDVSVLFGKEIARGVDQRSRLR